MRRGGGVLGPFYRPRPNNDVQITERGGVSKFDAFRLLPFNHAGCHRHETDPDWSNGGSRPTRGPQSARHATVNCLHLPGSLTQIGLLRRLWFVLWRGIGAWKRTAGLKSPPINYQPVRLSRDRLLFCRNLYIPRIKAIYPTAILYISLRMAFWGLADQFRATTLSPGVHKNTFPPLR